MFSIIIGNISKSPQLRLASQVVKFSSTLPSYETLAVSTPSKHVYHVELNRPDQFNTFTNKLWDELMLCFDNLSLHEECRVVVLSGKGKHFTGGIDLKDFTSSAQEVSKYDDVARKAKYLHGYIKRFQDAISSLEKCSKPVIAVTHNGCIGAGVDLITAADIRYCTEDAWFQVKEVDIGLAADVGTLQRLPRVIGNMSTARELCYTARKVDALEAVSLGLVSKVYRERESAITGAIEVASTIAEKSPVAVQVTKKSIIYSMEHSVDEGLEHIRNLNQTYLQSEDLLRSVMAALQKEKPVFDNL